MPSSNTPSIHFSLAPVYHTLIDLVIIANTGGDLQISDAWESEIKSSLSPETIRATRIFDTYLNNIFLWLLGEKDWPDFPSFLTQLKEMDATRLRDDFYR